MIYRPIQSFIALSLLAVAALGTVGTPAFGEEAKAKSPEKVTYDQHVRPIFREHCFSCHNQSDRKSDLALDSFQATIEGGAGGEVIFAGDLESSRLWALVSHEETPVMPPEQDKLPDAKLNVIKAWIEGGALQSPGSPTMADNDPAMSQDDGLAAAQPQGTAVMPEGVWRQPVLYTERAAAVTAMATSPWAPLAAIAGQKQIVLYHTETGALVGILPFPEGIPHVLRFSRNGALLLAGGGRGAAAGIVALYDIQSGRRLKTFGDELDIVLTADINDDHSLIALGGPKKVVRIYSTADGSLVNEITKHTEWITALAFSPDGVLLASADRNGGVLVWEAETAREYLVLGGHGLAVTEISWRADSNALASSSEDGLVRIWDVYEGKRLANIQAHGGGVLSVHWAGNGHIVTAGRDKLVKLWDAAGKHLKDFPGLTDIVMRARLSHDANRAIGGDWTGTVRMWDAGTAEAVADLAPNPPTLEMVLERSAQEAATAKQLAEEANQQFVQVKTTFDQVNKSARLGGREAAAAQEAATLVEALRAAAAQELEQKQAAYQAAMQQLEDAQAAASGATGDGAAGSAEATAAAQSALDEAEVQRLAAEKALAVLAAAQAAAAELATQSQAESEKRAAALAQVEPTFNEKQAMATAANEKLSAAQAQLAAAQAEKEAFDRAAEQLATAAKQAADQAAAAQAAADKVTAEHQAAVKAVEEFVAALKQAGDTLAAAKQEEERLAELKMRAEEALARSAEAAKSAAQAASQSERRAREAESDREQFEAAQAIRNAK